MNIFITDLACYRRPIAITDGGGEGGIPWYQKFSRSTLERREHEKSLSLVLGLRGRPTRNLFLTSLSTISTPVTGCVIVSTAK